MEMATMGEVYYEIGRFARVGWCVAPSRARTRFAPTHPNFLAHTLADPPLGCSSTTTHSITTSPFH